MKQKIAVIGSGIAGLASAIRLSTAGHEVTVFEQSNQTGGKISQLHLNGFRFDTGPSLFTMPELVEELFLLCGENPPDHFATLPLQSSCMYFWEDGSRVNAWQQGEDFAREVENATGVNQKKVMGFLKKSARLYDLTKDVFLFESLHKPSNYIKKSFLKSLIRFYELDAFTTMHKRNVQRFRHPKVVQLFDRYATYNGSNPYKTPATLNIIGHLEHNTGASFPAKGMFDIVESLTGLAIRQGVKIRLNSPVERVRIENKKAVGVRAGGQDLDYHRVVSDVDVVKLYRNMMPGVPFPKKQLSLDRSSSAMIFYWGIKGSFPQLGLHNILFSKDYPGEFHHLFDLKQVFHDPTVYIFISSRAVTSDAPNGHENWYVMINAPEIDGQNWDALAVKARSYIVDKIRRTMHIDVEKHIVTEHRADPRSIEAQTGSHGGSLYGLSSNSMFSAFNRHPNFKKSIKNLYFVGGSVHPGGGIPLCLASAKIISREIDPA